MGGVATRSDEASSSSAVRTGISAPTRRLTCTASAHDRCGPPARWGGRTGDCERSKSLSRSCRARVASYRTSFIAFDVHSTSTVCSSGLRAWQTHVADHASVKQTNKRLPPSKPLRSAP